MTLNKEVAGAVAVTGKF